MVEEYPRAPSRHPIKEVAVWKPWRLLREHEHIRCLRDIFSQKSVEKDKIFSTIFI